MMMKLYGDFEDLEATENQAKKRSKTRVQKQQKMRTILLIFDAYTERRKGKKKEDDDNVDEESMTTEEKRQLNAAKKPN